MILTLPIAIDNYVEPMSGERRLLSDLYLAGLPLWISFSLVLGSSLVVGLPAHFILQKACAGSRRTYIFVGALTGFLVPLAVLLAIHAVEGSFWMAFLGAFSGAMTARSWSKSLDQPVMAAEA
jgi:uncharacterized membrane protein